MLRSLLVLLTAYCLAGAMYVPEAAHSGLKARKLLIVGGQPAPAGRWVLVLHATSSTAAADLLPAA